MVLERRYQHWISQGERCEHLGRVADAEGNLGPVYGAQWCDWRSVDGRSIHQIDEVIESIQKNQTAEGTLSQPERGGNRSNGVGSLPCLVPLLVVEGELSCQLYQRSADLFLGSLSILLPTRY